MADIDKVNVTKLNDSNYQLWKFKMKMILMRDGVWENVNSPKPEGDKLPANWNNLERKAIAAIGLAVEDSQLVHLITITSARDMWLKLQSLHERSSICSKLYLIRKLYSMRFTTGTMAVHVSAMLEIVNQLRGLGKDLSDEDIVAALLCSLPESYSTLVTTLEGRAESDLTVDYVRGKLIDEYNRRIESDCANEIALKMSDQRNPSVKPNINQMIEKWSSFISCYMTCIIIFYFKNPFSCNCFTTKRKFC